ncbi:MAG TPA: DUF4249 family protein [Longimicrobium sp.]|jgi:hypothetical protein|nr:DUF4249 family protein [Longimicrobium sp.]
MRRLLICALLLGSAACLREPDPFEYSEPALSVHGVLRADETGVDISLFRGRPEGGVEPVTAQVTLSSGGTTVPLARLTGAETERCYANGFFSDEFAFPGCYGGTLPQPAVPGSRWTLTADLEDGPTVTGSTVVPVRPTVTSPTRLEYTQGQETVQLEVGWQTPAAPRVEIRLGEGFAWRKNAWVQGSVCMAAHNQLDDAEAVVDRPSGTRRVEVVDVFCYNPTNPGGPFVWDSASVPLVVTAFDSAYAEFALHGRSVTSGHQGASLQNAYGVFGSAAITRRDIVFIPRR